MWIKNNTVYKTHLEIRRSNPQVSMPRDLTEALLTELGYDVLHPTAAPQGDVIIEGTPAFNENTQQWKQTWEVRDFTPEEVEQNLANRRAEMVVTPRQARLALLGAGQLANIEAAITALEEPTKSAVEIEWEYAVQIERTSPWVQAMTAALGMTDEQTDQLFEAAAQL
jgi:hypothetical protein